ncbi:hypothetical protein ACJZ2D_007731 [Fusarium nematophilum]
MADKDELNTYLEKQKDSEDIDYVNQHLDGLSGRPERAQQAVRSPKFHVVTTARADTLGNRAWATMVLGSKRVVVAGNAFGERPQF